MVVFILVAFAGLVLAFAVNAQGAGWTQVNTDGFGDLHNSYILALAPFSGQLYASTYNDSGNGAQLWRMNQNGSWTPVITDGFGITRNIGIVLFPFNSQLYASTWADIGSEVWRSGNGLNWTRVVTQGLGDMTNTGVFCFGALSDTLYASVANWTNGAEIWRSNTGDSGDWTRVITNGFGDAHNGVVNTLEVFNSYLYAGTINWNTTALTSTGGEVWRTSDGITWTQVNTSGFGTIHNYQVSALAGFNNYLYASTTHDSEGVQVWRCQACDGSDWTKMVNNGFGNAHTNAASALIVFDSRLYFVVGNFDTGLEVWRTANGTNWEQIGFTGLGDSNNKFPYWDNPVAVFNDGLYVGTANQVSGGEVWQYLPVPSRIFLPIVIKQ